MINRILISELSEINIIGGQIISRVEAKDEKDKLDTMKVLLPKAISNGFVSMSDVGTVDVKIDVDMKKVTKEGDIVLKLSTPYDACLITKKEEGLLVPSFCAIINDIPKILSKEYLLAYLNSTACSNQIKNLVTGSTIAILSVSQIKKLEIPVPDFSLQQEIGTRYLEGINKIKLLNKIVKLEKEYLDSKIFEMEE